MEKYSFFPSIDGDRKYKTADWAAYFATLIGNGVFAGVASALQVAAGSGLTVTIGAGKAWINGYLYELTEDMQVTLDTANASYARIDRIVVRLDLLNRNISAGVLKGTAAASPVPPAYVRYAYPSVYYDLVLANIAVAANTVTITAANITDTRADATLCGWVTGTVSQIDATGLFAQFQAAFDEWFGQAREVLGADTAGNLLALINTKAGKAADLTGTLTAAGWSGSAPPYTQTVAGLMGLLAADTGVSVCLTDNPTAEQCVEAAKAFITPVSYADGSMTFSAMGMKPGADIPIVVRRDS